MAEPGIVRVKDNAMDPSISLMIINVIRGSPADGVAVPHGEELRLAVQQVCGQPGEAGCGQGCLVCDGQDCVSSSGTCDR